MRGTTDGRHRLLEKLIREVVRMEAVAINLEIDRGARRVADTPPSLALDAVAAHAGRMRGRLLAMLSAHELAVHRSALGATLSSLRQLVVDRVTDAEQAFRTAILDLRHGLDVVRLLREVARAEEVFGVIRWCDDWLGARRTLVARAEAQLAWYDEADADGELPTANLVDRAGDAEDPTYIEIELDDHEDRADPDRHPTSPQRRDRP